MEKLFPAPPNSGNTGGRAIWICRIEQVPDRLLDKEYTAHAALGADGRQLSQPYCLANYQDFADQAGIAIENVRYASGSSHGFRFAPR